MKGKMYFWRGRCIYEGEDVFMKAKMCLWRGRCIYEGKMYLWRGRCILIADINKFREFLKEKSERNVWESVLAKNPGFFEPFATARFYNSKGKQRCADCRFVTDAVRAQISIKKSRIFMRNGKGKPPIIKGKMYLWRGRSVYEGEDVFMKGKMYLWREDVFMKGEKKILEFLNKLKIRCFSKTKEIPGISHRRHKQIPGIFARKIRT